MFIILILQWLKSEDGNKHEDAGQLSVQAAPRDALSGEQRDVRSTQGYHITAAVPLQCCLPAVGHHTALLHRTAITSSLLGDTFVTRVRRYDGSSQKS